VDNTNHAIDRNAVSLRKQQAAQESAGGSLIKFVGTITGFGDASSAASRKSGILPRIIAAIGLGTGPAEAALSALVGTVGSLTAAVTAGAAGLLAYGLALKPLLTQAGSVVKAQATLDTARARAQAQYAGALKAGVGQQTAAAAKTKALQAAQAQYNATVGQAPPAVRAFGKELTAAQTAYHNWATSLAGPVLEPLRIGLTIVKPLLHDLSPLAVQAAKALSELALSAANAVKSSGFQQWLKQITPLIFPVISGLGHAIGNIIVGFGNIVKAFTPFAGTVIAGLDRLTKRFRDWSQNLSQHSGFQAMLGQWQTIWPKVRQAMGQALTVIINIVKAWASMTTGGNSQWMWNVANPLLALLRQLSGHPAIVQLFTYMYLASKGAGQLKNILDSAKSGWGAVTRFIALITGGKVQLGMQGAGDTMLAASRNMLVAADRMAAAAPGAAAGGAAAGAEGGAAAGAAARGGLIGRALSLLGPIGIPVFATMHIRLPGQGQTIWQGVVASFERYVGGPITGWFESAFTPGGKINQALLAGWNRMWHGIVSGTGSAFSPGGALNQSLLRAFSGAARWLVRTGGDIVSGLSSGIHRAWSAFINFWTGLPGRLIHSFMSLFGIGSPSKVMAGIGRDIILGLGRGVQLAWAGLFAWLRRIPGWILGIFNGAGRWLVRSGQNIIGGLANGIAAGWRTVSRWFGGLPGRLTAFFRGSLRWLFGGGQDVIQGLYNGILSIWHKVTAFITGIPGWIKAHKGPLSLDAQLLVPAGKAIMSGLHLGLLTGAGGPLGFLSGLAGTIGDLVAGGLGGLLKKLRGTPSGGGPSVQIGRVLAAAMGWTGAQFSALFNLWMGESGWRWNALNASSGAYGIPQSLPASKMAAAGADWRTNPATQIRWGLAYIKSVYGSPLNAYRMWLARSPHWYERGSWSVPVTGPATVHRGEMILPQPLAEAVRQVLTGGDGGSRHGAPVLNVGTLNVTSQADAILLARSATFYWRHAGGMG